MVCEMMVKLVILFLLAMVLVGMVGKVIFPGGMGRETRRRLGLAEARRCPTCGRPMVGARCDHGKS